MEGPSRQHDSRRDARPQSSFGNIVAGLEVDYNFADARYEGTEKNSFGSFGTFRGRLGYVIDRTLIFATAGLAVARIPGSTEITADLYYAPVPSFSKSTWGWVAGGGVEHALNSKLTIKAEALYADFRSSSADTFEIIPSSPFGPATTAKSFQSNTSAVFGRVGTNFKF